MKKEEFIKQLMDTKEIVDYMFYLNNKWNTQQYFEDINSYYEEMKKFIKPYIGTLGVYLNKISTKPFTFWFKCKDGVVKFIIKNNRIFTEV